MSGEHDDFRNVGPLSRRLREMLQSLAGIVVRRDQITFGPNIEYRNIPGSPLYINAVRHDPDKPAAERFLARITAAGATGGLYEAVEVQRSGGTYVDVTDGKTWTASELGEVAELNSIEGLEPIASEIVPIEVFRSINLSGSVYWLFAAPSRTGEMFAVNLTQDGGSDGNATTQASWTYTATDLDGVQRGTGLTPKLQRPAVGKVANGDGKVGQGYLDADGAFQLFSANEVIGGAQECS